MSKKYITFKKIYDELSIEYKTIIEHFIYSLMHDFTRDDANVHANIDKLRKQNNLSLSALAEKSKTNLDTIQKNRQRNCKELKDADRIAEFFNISEYELLYGEPPLIYESKKIIDLKSTFEYQNPALQDAIINLARDLYLLSIQ